MNRKTLVLIVATVLLGACATAPTVYGPAANGEASGYRDIRIEELRYRVTFRGGSDLKADQVEDYTLRRAAELATQQGGDWFRIVDRRTDQIGGRSGGGTSVGVGGSSGSFGSSVGVGVGIDLTPDRRKFETTMEILIGRGPKPDEARVYDARAILSRPDAPALPPR